MKLTPKKIESCAQWVRENGLTDYGGASIEMFCKAHDITKTTYYRWIEDNDFSDAIEKARDEYAENLERDLVVSLAKAAKGYSYTKKKTEYGNGSDNKPIIKKQTIEDVEVSPNVGAAIFLLTNLAPERWKNKIQNDVNADVKSENKTELDYNISDIPEDLLYQVVDKIQDAEFQRLKNEKEGKK